MTPVPGLQRHGIGTLETDILQLSRIQRILISQQEPIMLTLTVSNANGTASKTATITVLDRQRSSGGSSAERYGSSGGEVVAVPVVLLNLKVMLKVKELSQTFITSGKPVKFDFPKNATPVVYVSFDSKKTAGKTTTIVEMLKEKSTLVSGATFWRSLQIPKYLGWKQRICNFKEYRKCGRMFQG